MFTVSAQDEYLSPLLYNGNLRNDNVANRTGEGSIDSTFIYTYGTLDIDFIYDDFSSDKFVDYNVGYADAGVTSTWYYQIMNATGTLPLASDIVLCDSSKAHRTTVSFTVGVPTTTSVYDFPATPVKINDLSEYPVTAQDRTLYEACMVIIDTIIDAVPDVSPDTIFYTGAPEGEPTFTQDSAHVFFKTMNENGKIWVDHFATRNYGLAFQPWSLGVVTLDGVDENGWPYDFGNLSAHGTADYLTSKPINLAGKTDVYLDFIYQAEGYGDAPEESDSLILELYYPPEDKWVVSDWRIDGGITPDIWDTVHFAVPPLFLVNGFQFRFRNKANTSGWLDHWHIDYIRLKDNQLADEAPNFKDVAISEPIYTLLQDYTSVPWDHFKNATPVDKMLDEIVIKGYNCDNTNTNFGPGAFEVSYMGSIVGGPFSLGATGDWIVGITEYPIPVASNYAYDNAITTDPQATFNVKVNISTGGGTASKNSNQDNDTTRFQQEFKNYYAYDDGSAELAYGVTGNRSMLAYKFEAYEEDTLTGILMSFVPSVEDLSNNIFLLTIWADNNGEPGEIIYQDNFFNPHYPEYPTNKDNFRYYTFADGQAVKVPETFYVGWDQIDDERLNIGIDMNIPNNDKIFYNTSGTWNQSAFEGSLLIRPVFSTALNYTLYNPEFESEKIDVTIYPNPSTGLFQVSGLPIGYQIQVFDITGRVLAMPFIDDTIDLSDFENGVYLVQILDVNGNPVDTKKITKF